MQGDTYVSTKGPQWIGRGLGRPCCGPWSLILDRLRRQWRQPRQSEAVAWTIWHKPFEWKPTASAGSQASWGRGGLHPPFQYHLCFSLATLLPEFRKLWRDDEFGGTEKRVRFWLTQDDERKRFKVFSSPFPQFRWNFSDGCKILIWFVVWIYGWRILGKRGEISKFRG